MRKECLNTFIREQGTKVQTCVLSQSRFSAALHQSRTHFSALFSNEALRFYLNSKPQKPNRMSIREMKQHLFLFIKAIFYTGEEKPEFLNQKEKTVKQTPVLRIFIFAAGLFLFFGSGFADADADANALAEAAVDDAAAAAEAADADEDTTASEEEEKPDETCKQVKGLLRGNQAQLQKDISKLKKKCKADYESVKGYCTQEGLANIQAISAGGQSVASAVSILKSDGSPGSAKKAMNMTKTVSYGLGVLNTGIGAKCLANIKSCTSSCGKIDKITECLERLKFDPTVVGPPTTFIEAEQIETQYIEPLSKVEGHTGECKGLTSNAIAALAQGALHGVTGMIHGEIAKTLGQGDKDTLDEGEPEDPASEPTVPKMPTPQGLPTPSNVGTNSVGGAAKLTGNTPSMGAGLTPEDEDEFDPSQYGDEEEDSNFGRNPSGSLSGNSPGSNSSLPVSYGAAPSSSGRDGGSSGEEELEPEASFSSGTGYAGFQGSSSNHYGSGGGYDSDEEMGAGSLAKSPAEKKKEELKRLKESIGGKHENIFEKASKIIAAFCLEGPIKCE